MSKNFDKEDITELLHHWDGGDERARNDLFQRLYEKMLRIVGETDASLVHDAFLRLSRYDGAKFRNRVEFGDYWVKTIRNLRTDRYRREEVRQRPLDGMAIPQTLPDDAMMRHADLAHALDELAALDEKSRLAANAFTLRAFSGLEVKEIALLQNQSEAIVRNLLKRAKDFLHIRLSET